jgi:hypothetical protein
MWLAGLMAPVAAAAQESSPPSIDCSLGFQMLQAQAAGLAGAQRAEDQGFDIVTVSQPDAWRAEIAFTTQWHPAYPAVTIRTFRRQVTGVWTAESKSCGYGDQTQFAALVEHMKARDKELTDASRAEVERQKQSRSPLAPPH